MIRTSRRPLPALLALALVACGTSGPSATPSEPGASSLVPSGSASASPAVGAIEPAPGSSSAVYEPNPGAIVVAVDAGHGGCLDWGVADPSERGVEWAEKTLTLGIAQRLRDRLEADGIGVVMIRDADEALAGDNEPDFGCDGPPWRDVDGDGNSGFEESGRIRTRDELQARIDLANLAGADAFVSIHINSPTEGGQVIEVAFGETFYDDETPWGPDESASLAAAIQRGAVAAIDPLTTYERQDRGIEAVAYYAISRAWAEGDECEHEGDEYCKPHRGLLMPSALSEVGSISLRAEHDLLASDVGQAAVADGIFNGLGEYFNGRGLAARIGLEGEPPGTTPTPLPGDGPLFWPPLAPGQNLAVRVTNNGTEAWSEGGHLVAGWGVTDAPYLSEAPSDLAVVAPDIPDLAPGESILVDVAMPEPPAERAVAWISLEVAGERLSDLGSPPLQLSSEAP